MRHFKTTSCILAGAFFAAQLGAQVPVTPEELIARNLGPRDQVNKPFPPHKIIGNIYFVGPQALGSFLIVTPAGLILINSDYEVTVPVVRASIEQLGFKYSDIKILLGSHAHGDHMEADAAVKELTGAQVMAMAEDVPALQAMRPGNKPHPIDRILHDGDQVTLGGTTLVAHLTPGHTKGCTTWTLKAEEGGKSYDVVIVGSAGVNPGVKLVNNADYPQIADDYVHTFRTLRALHCDVPLGSHPGMFGMAAKYAQVGKGPNPYIDPEGYQVELDINDAVFYRTLAAQKKGRGPLTSGMLQFSEPKEGQSARLRAGETFEIALAETPGAGFRWKMTADGSPACELLHDAFVPARGVGGEGLHRWSFRAAKPGAGEIQLMLRRSWESSTDPAQTFSLRVTVAP